MPQSPKTSYSPLSIRLSPQEWKIVRERAAGLGLSLSGYARQQILAKEVTPRRTRGKAPVKDHKALGQILSYIGQLRWASNLNQLAKTANQGPIILTPEVETAILEVCADIRMIKNMLMKALGLRDK
jgi:Mobilization protein NikA